MKVLFEVNKNTRGMIEKIRRSGRVFSSTKALPSWGATLEYLAAAELARMETMRQAASRKKKRRDYQL